MLRVHVVGMFLSTRLTRLRLTLPPNSGQDRGDAAAGPASAGEGPTFWIARTTKTTPKTAATQAASTQRRRAG